jgi:hypothetical protein
MKKNDNEPVSWIFGDGHVHVHECYDIQELFATALKNFHEARNNIHREAKAEFYLFLTESAGVDWFDRWKKLVGKGQETITGFSVATTGDDNCLCLSNKDGDSLFIVAGRQIVTAESLEVLALGEKGPYPDGRPIATVLQELDNETCLRVLPWGAGKWLGKRGRTIRDILTGWNEGTLFLGDNGNRPYFWPLPSTFAIAGQRSIYNLPGSDPLPFSGQEKRAGSYGFFLPGMIDTKHPFASVRKMIIQNSSAMCSYGRTERFMPFFRHQLAMQFCKKNNSCRQP